MQIINRKIYLLLILTFVANQSIYGQIIYGHIPDGNRIDWTKSGLHEGTLKDAKHIVYVDNMSGATNYDKLMNAINQASSPNSNELTIIKFSANKTYTFNSTITLNAQDSNIVFQGEGNSTVLSFNGIYKTNPSFEIIGSSTNISSNLVNPINKKSFELEFMNSTELNDYKTGDWIHFYERNYPVKDKTSYSTVVGQITQITGKSSTRLNILNEAARKYDKNAPTSGDGLFVRKINPIKNVGFENLLIERKNTDDGTGGSTFVFEYAVNCWIRGVHSQKTSEHHVVVRNSSNLEISGSYFSAAYSYGHGGRGYGINLKSSTSNCLIENNIFNVLRHAIVLEMGANSNVITYNYSHDQFSTTEYNDLWPDLNFEEWSDNDIILHGRYSFSNLIEHNWCERIAADDIHGKHGPFNVFARNMCKDKDGIMHTMTLVNAPLSSVLGNELRLDETYTPVITGGSTSLSTDLYGILIWKSGPKSSYETGVMYTHSYLAKNGIYVKDIMHLHDISYFYSGIPEFLRVKSQKVCKKQKGYAAIS